jgi:O-antigen ligase/Flp pilus assembly protein TadD
MNTYIMNRWGTMVGFISVAVVPLVFVDGINRFVLLPQLFVGLLGLLLGYACWWRFGIRRDIPNVVYVAAAFLVLEVISIAAAHTPGLGVIPILSDFANVSLLTLVAVGFSKKDIYRTCSAAAGVSGLISLIGLLQYFDIGRGLIPTSGLPSATLGHRNIAAAYVVGVLPYVALKFWTSRDRVYAAFWASCGMLATAFMIATRSRAAWISGVVICAVGGLVWLKHRKDIDVILDRFRLLLVVAGVLIAVGLSLMPAEIGKDQGEAMWHEKASVEQAVRSISASGGDKGRLLLWDTTLKMIRNQPIIGVGPGNWRIHFPVHAQGQMIDANSAPHRAHNDLLTIWSESGIGPLVLFLVLVFCSFRSAWRCSDTEPLLAVAAAASIAGCITSGLFGFPREFYGATAPMWFGFGVLATLERSSGRRADTKRKAVPLLGFAVVCAGLIVTTQAIRLDADLLKARLAAARSDWTGVLESTRNFVGWRLTNELVYLLRGRAFDDAGRHPEASEAYRIALSIHPNAPELWLGLGVAQSGLGEGVAARQSFERALMLDPKDGRALSNLGTLSATEGNLQAAIGFLERAIESESTPLEVYGNLSTAYRRGGAIDQAVATARRGLEIGQSSSLFNALGNALAGRGDHLDAVRAYEAGLALDPDQLQLLFNLARSYESLNRPGDAILTYQKVLRQLGEQLPDRKSFIERRITQLEMGRGSRQ